MADARKPWATLEPDGVHVHLPMPNGTVVEWPCTPEGAYALIGLLSEQFGELTQNPDLQKKVGGAVVNSVIDWFDRRKRP